MSQAIRHLAPHLQVLWAQVYAIAWGHNAYQDTEGNPKNAHEKAEEAAWEAVTRANGGISPTSPSAIEVLAPVVASVLWSRALKKDGGTHKRPDLIEMAAALLRAPEVGTAECELVAKCALAVWDVVHGRAL